MREDNDKDGTGVMVASDNDTQVERQRKSDGRAITIREDSFSNDFATKDLGLRGPLRLPWTLIFCNQYMALIHFIGPRWLVRNPTRPLLSLAVNFLALMEILMKALSIEKW